MRYISLSHIHMPIQEFQFNLLAFLNKTNFIWALKEQATLVIHHMSGKNQQGLDEDNSLSYLDNSADHEVYNYEE